MNMRIMTWRTMIDDDHDHDDHDHNDHDDHALTIDSEDEHYDEEEEHYGGNGPIIKLKQVRLDTRGENKGRSSHQCT